MKRFWEPKLEMWQVAIVLGEFHVSRTPEVITTVLGSCIAACIRDPQRNVGGINHFLLPDAPKTANADDGESLRYGVYALECLINGVLRGGGRRETLEVKVFGGGRVIEGNTDVGRKNIEFARAFFKTEGIKIASEDVGGTFARRLRFWPTTGRAQVLQIPMAKADVPRPVAPAPSSGSVELF